MDSLRHFFSISELCKALGVSRSGYHAATKRVPDRRKAANAQLLAHMQAIQAERHTRCCGSHRMPRELQGLALPARKIASPASCARAA